MVGCEQAFCLGDMLARSLSWLSSARSFGSSLARSFSCLASAFSLVSRLCILSRDWLTRSLSWLACAFSLAARLRVLSLGSFVHSVSRLAYAFSLLARLCILSRGLLTRSLSWLPSAFSLVAWKRKWKAYTHANHLHVLKSTQQATPRLSGSRTGLSVLETLKCYLLNGKKFCLLFVLFYYINLFKFNLIWIVDGHSTAVKWWVCSIPK